MELGLEGILAEVGDDPVAVGAHFLAEFDSQLSDAGHEVTALPQLLLGHVCCGDEHDLDGEPVEAVAEYEDVVFFVNLSGWQASGDYLAECAVLGHGLSLPSATRRSLGSAAPAAIPAVDAVVRGVHADYRA